MAQIPRLTATGVGLGRKSLGCEVIHRDDSKIGPFIFGFERNENRFDTDRGSPYVWPVDSSHVKRRARRLYSDDGGFMDDNIDLDLASDAEAIRLVLAFYCILEPERRAEVMALARRYADQAALHDQIERLSEDAEIKTGTA